MTNLGARTARRRVFAIAGVSAVLAGLGYGFVPAATAAVPRATQPISTALNSGVTARTSSTGHKLFLTLTATHSDATATAGTSANTDTLDITLANNRTIFGGESHSWSFRIPSTALVFNTDSAGNPDGNGSLTVPASAISPFGVVKLKFAPAGTPTTQQCNGQPSSQTQPVSLSGTFFFDSKSTGSHKWGTEGSKTATFTFAATNDVVTTYATTDFSCSGPAQVPCASAITWFANHGGISFDGTGAGSANGSIFGNRSNNLTKPAGAIRKDLDRGRSKPLALVTKGGTTTLSVLGARGAVGSASLKSAKSQGPFSNPCMGGTEQITAWSGASYRNGSTPLQLKMQIYGILSLANGSGQQDGFERVTK